MTAFDIAWSLLKMPIVPVALKGMIGERFYNTHHNMIMKVGDYPIAIWNAKFEHPDTGEIHPMQWRALLNRNVVDENFTPHFLGNIGYDMSQVNVHNQIYTEPEERKVFRKHKCKYGRRTPKKGHGYWFHIHRKDSFG